MDSTVCRCSASAGVETSVTGIIGTLIESHKAVTIAAMQAGDYALARRHQSVWAALRQAALALEELAHSGGARA